jgi:hypothetical protein
MVSNIAAAAAELHHCREPQQKTSVCRETGEWGKNIGWFDGYSLKILHHLGADLHGRQCSLFQTRAGVGGLLVRFLEVVTRQEVPEQPISTIGYRCTTSSIEGGAASPEAQIE